MALEDYQSKVTETNLRYPRTLGDSDTNPSWIQFAFFERKDETRSAPSDKIHLYMPESVAQPSTVSWDTESFGFVGNAAVKAMRSYNQTDGFLAGVQSGGKKGWNELQGGIDLMAARSMANIGSMAVGLMGGSATAEGIMGESMGKVPNPYLTMIFRGVDFRNFSFVFKFYPHSEDDCKVIDDIIKTFRANALPAYDSGRAFLGYPKECDITYMWRDKRNPWLHRFKKAVCTGVDVDYTSSGMFSTMRNGFPSEITMATKWSEIELVTRDDVFISGEDGGF